MSEIVMRAKMAVTSVVIHRHLELPEGEPQFEDLYLRAVYSDDPDSENHIWSRWTPDGEIRLTVSNPNMFGKFVVGDEYYIDFTPAEK